ncbi:MAG: elongation factor G [Ignavibacteriales bacterium]
MKEYLPESMRNLCFIGHGSSGKTTLAEVCLYTAGETTRIGTIAEGNTQSDYTSNEIEKQFSISLSLLHFDWKNCKINWIDTPGYTDFIGEVKCAMKVADTAVMVLKAFEGVEVGSEITGHFVNEFKMPSAIVINKCDNEKSRFDEVVTMAKERLTNGAMVVTFPVNPGPEFDTVVDVISMKAYTYGPAGSKKVTVSEIPADLKAKADEYRTLLIEKVAELNEEFMNEYFETGSLSDEDLKTGITESLLKRSFTPVFATSSANVAGINNFLDFIEAYFPNPLQMPAVTGKLKDKEELVEIKPDPKAEPVIFVFKTLAEQHVGELSLFRVFSGEVHPGMDMVNEANGKIERLNQLSILNGRNRRDVHSLVAGDMGAVVKLKDTHTNNTLASKNLPVILDEIVFPEPIIRGAIQPKAKGDEDKIATGLHTLSEEDPSFSVKYDPEIAQTIISGQGELQLSLAVKRLKERYKVEVDLIEPRIPYREAIKGKCLSAEYKHKKQSGGRGQYGHVFLKLEPQPRGAGFQFEDAIVGGVVPGRFIPAVEKGVQDSLIKGVLAGYPIVDVKCTLFDGSYHDVDSDEMSFKIAASMGFKKAFMESKPVLLEPIYDVAVTVPEEFMGDVMGDMSSRRGKILGMDADGHFQKIKAQVPLSELYKYSSALRSLTQGRGSHTRKFSHYEEVPKEVEHQIVEEYKKSRAEGA